MGSKQKVYTRSVLLAVVVLFAALRAPAQTASVAPRITQAVDENNLVVLRGNVHPLIRGAGDLGAVSDAQPLTRMLLLLKRSPEQESALQSLLDQQQTKSSANYHKWLTPEQFGQQFGPADADLQAVTNWLQSQGFQVTQITKGRTVIEFSGNVAQVRNAFHTQMRRYSVNGKEQVANASDPQIPAALAPVVAGVVSLNDFPRKSYLRELGTFQKSKATGEVKPLFTFPGCQSGNCYALGPADFATIYNTAPLLKANPPVDGTGVTIAIVGESNINVQDVTDFRAMFGLPLNFTNQNVILNGPDPGINGSEVESDLDIEWSGAVAPGATIDFVTSEPTETTAGIDLSAVYIVDNNLAAVMSESFGACEQYLGSAGNQFYNQLWEQAAAQGITVMLSTGDGGSAGCDDFNSQQTANLGLAVSGFASTPYNVAVGGTDFDQAGRESTFWNTTPTTTTPPVPASALSYIPEVPWNDSCAQNGLSGCSSGNLLDIVAGSGGASTIYSKPAWQMGVAGMPNDSRRDLPDISLFASNGFHGSFYIMCARDITGTSSCSLTNAGYTFLGVGGTSASAPAFAGIMALVNQKTGQRQGNANYILYSLVKKTGASCNSNSTTLPPATCTFYDVTKGNNSVPCAGNSANCSSHVAGTNGVLVEPASPSTPAYSATAGYDQATGLGSVNAQNLVNNWNSVNLTATTTTLTLNNGSAVSVAHGTAVPVQVSVTPTAAKGNVSLIAQLANGSTLGLGTFTLGTNGSVSGTTSALPGGTNYSVYAHYAGDGTNAPSDSSAVNVTVNPESSTTLISVPTFDPTTGNETGNAPTTLGYGSPYILRVDVGNASAKLMYPQQPVCQPPACPTGTVTITDNGSTAAPNGGTFTLNSAGYTEDRPVQFNGGQHTIVAAYSGDSSYKPSSSTYALTITLAPTSTQLEVDSSASNIVAGGQFTVSIIGTVQALSGIAPTGSVTFYDGTTQLGNPVTIFGAPVPYFPSYQAIANITIASGGKHTLTATYSGDSNYQSSSSSPVVVNVLYPTTASIIVNPSSVVYGNTVTITATADTAVSASNTSLKPTGGIGLHGTFDGQITNGVSTTVTSDTNGNWEIQATATVTPSNSEYFIASYGGDNSYAFSTATSSLVTVNIPDFALGPASGLSVIPAAGQAGSGQITITPLSQTPSTVTLSLSPLVFSGYNIVLNPQQVTLNGSPATATISLTPSTAAATNLISSQARHATFFVVPSGDWRLLGFATGLAVLFLLVLPGRRKRYPMAVGAGLACLLCFVIGCGGGSAATGTGGGGGGGGPVPTSITLTTSNAKVDQNSAVTLTAQITAQHPLSGMVSLYDYGNQFLGTFPINGSQAVVGELGNFYGIGIHQITAKYSGDAQNLPSTSNVLTQVITGTIQAEVQGKTGGDIHYLQVTLGVQ
jgi:subtilase family serine protease